ncbi:MAG: GIY-YIG nuclease family protein [Candidatus Buchananbacteria bacterium]
MKDKSYCVYLMSNKSGSVIYTGVTNDLERRVYVHKNKVVKGFTSRYNVNKLVYFEEFGYIGEAILRKK